MAWSDMESKQKGMLVALIIVLAIIGYMGYKFFWAGSSPAPIPAPKATVVAAQPQPAAAANNPASELATNDNSRAGVAASTVNTAAPGANAAAPGANPAAPGVNPAAPGANAAAPGAPSVPQVIEMPKNELTPEELSLLEERRQVQQQYLELVNQYQLMDMQNKVATSQSTLVKTQLETAKVEQQAARLGILLPGQQSTDSDADKSLRGITLVYVGQKNNVWSAVLNLRGQYVTVKQGSHLPDDSVVSKIDENGIVLYKDGERRILMLATVVEQTSGDTGDTTTTGTASSGNTANADASSDDTQ
ncbi:MAG: hypothetical protein K0R48_1321 [Gammaproteobacteria bacterium]|jgi:hypothetical protein|nr:hypothetical protein [Gammaproteobacteria bacterium]